MCPKLRYPAVYVFVVVACQLVRPGEAFSLPAAQFAGDATFVQGGTGAYYSAADSPAGTGVAPWKDESGLTRDLRSEQQLCPLGYYCVGGARVLCPAGRYGSTRGILLPTCTGVCEAGYYCPPGSVSSRERACGGYDVYCPEGSGYVRALCSCALGVLKLLVFDYSTLLLYVQ